MESNWSVKVEIKRIQGHYEGYVDGEFVCSGDTAVEVAADLDEHVNKLRGGAA